MSRIPFKRQLIILVCIITALCVAIPVAAFAKGTPSGEQKRHEQPKITHTAQGTVVTITSDCTSPQTLVTLNKGDIFNASATLTSNDPDEESEGETLQILDASTSPATVLLNLDVNTGSATIKPFTATVNNDPIQACIVGIDSDETGAVTFTVTTPPPTKVIIKAPFAISTSTHFHTPVPGSAGQSVCEGLSGFPKIQTDKSTGAVGYSAFAWGGLCGFFDPFVTAKNNPPNQEASIETLMGDVFTAPTSGTYRISVDITLHGNGAARSGSNVADIIQSFAPKKVGDILGLLGFFKLTNPGNFLPSVTTAQDKLVLKVESTETSTSKGFPSLAADSLLPAHDSQDEVFSGTHTVTMTIHLNAGQQVLILGGLSTDIKAWGNASSVIKPLNSTVDRIVVQLI